jgi:protein TonB
MRPPLDRTLLGLGRPSPRLPRTALPVRGRIVMAALVHAAIGVLLLALPTPRSTEPAAGTTAAVTARDDVAEPRMVFVAPPRVERGGGGGGGGNRQPGPIPRAQAPGNDLVTMPVTSTRVPAAVESEERAQHVLLDTKPLASGAFFLAGLPEAGPAQHTDDLDAQGPGSGGGFGTGDGSGVGSGTGPGAGPGTGGGTGGGVYKPGGTVSAPVLLAQVRPTYTDEALTNRIQGTVELELIVRSNGEPDAIRVVRSLDRGGLDVEAIRAVRQWRFRPGHVAGEPVDVLVTVVVNFSIH